MLNQDSTPKSRGNFGTRYSDPVAATQKIYIGATVCLDASGNAVKGATATGLKARGVAQKRTDNTSGIDGAVVSDTLAGVWARKNSSAGDLITRADIGNDCYIVDDEAVAKTNGGATRSVCGRIDDVDADGTVWVDFG